MSEKPTAESQVGLAERAKWLRLLSHESYLFNHRAVNSPALPVSYDERYLFHLHTRAFRTMKTLNPVRHALLVIILFSNSVFSQGAENLDIKIFLKDEISEMDRMLFDVAFNTCDLELYKKIMSPDLEFYDDRSGLNTSFEVEVASFKDRCSRPVSTTRKLVSMSVHVLGDYGAVELGKHEFYVDNVKVEKAKFVIVWERKGQSWLMKRTISYDHEPVSD